MISRLDLVAPWKGISSSVGGCVGVDVVYNVSMVFVCVWFIDSMRGSDLAGEGVRCLLLFRCRGIHI